MIFMIGIITIVVDVVLSLPNQPVSEEPGLEESPSLGVGPHHHATMQTGYQLQGEEGGEPDQSWGCQWKPEYIRDHQVKEHPVSSDNKLLTPDEMMKGFTT